MIPWPACRPSRQPENPAKPAGDHDGQALLHHSWGHDPLDRSAIRIILNWKPFESDVLNDFVFLTSQVTSPARNEMAMSDSLSGGKGNWDLFFAASGSDIPERAPDSSRFYEDHAVCRYTGVPAFAEIDGGLISAGYGSRYDFTLFVFLKGRPDDLPEGASVSDEILENWIKDGVIAVYQNDQGGTSAGRRSRYHRPAR